MVKWHIFHIGHKKTLCGLDEMAKHHSMILYHQGWDIDEFNNFEIKKIEGVCKNCKKSYYRKRENKDENA